MSKIAEKINKPYLVVIISVVLSVAIYLIIASVFEAGNFLIGISLAIVVPAIVSLPIAIILVGYIQKINKQKEELIKLDAINKKLFSLISHDIRSPITTLKTMVDLVVDDSLSDKEEKEYLKLLSKRIDVLLLFLGDLLKWSHDQIENKPIEFKFFKPSTVIATISSIYENLLIEKNIKFSLSSLDQNIYGDEQNYAFVVRNVIHNAIKFTPENGQIEVTIKMVNDEIHTIVKDSGVGLSKAEIDNLLDREKWFTKKGTSDEVGTGFGINTCLEYLEKNNGRLLIESKANRGTQIAIILPNKKPKK